MGGLILMPKLKKCTKCKELKLTCNFSKISRNPDGLNRQCKDCYNKGKRDSYKPSKISIVCNKCNVSYSINKSSYEGNNNHRCRKCYHKEVAIRNEGTYVDRIIVKCDNCNVEFERLESHIAGKANIYCSIKCKDIGFGKLNSRENNCNWNPNKSDEDRIIGRAYSSYHKWRREVYERDNYTCQHCGDDYGGNLNAHHIFSYGKYIELRTEVDNGVTWCESCHKEFHRLYGYGDNNELQYYDYINSEQLSIFN